MVISFWLTFLLIGLLIQLDNLISFDRDEPTLSGFTTYMREVRRKWRMPRKKFRLPIASVFPVSTGNGSPNGNQGFLESSSGKSASRSIARSSISFAWET